MLVNTAKGGELFMVPQKSIQLSNWMKSGEEKKASPQGDGYWKKKEFLCRSGGTVSSRRVGMWMEEKQVFLCRTDGTANVSRCGWVLPAVLRKLRHI